MALGAVAPLVAGCWFLGVIRIGMMTCAGPAAVSSCGASVGRCRTARISTATCARAEAVTAHVVRRRLADCIRPNAPGSFAVGGAAGAAISWLNWELKTKARRAALARVLMGGRKR
jgi:hypothetical protein